MGRGQQRGRLETGRIPFFKATGDLRGIHAGALANSAAAEAMTSVLIFINKTYQVDGAGLVVTGQLIDPAI